MAIVGGLAAALFFATATLCASRASKLIPPTSVLAWVMVTGLLAVLPTLAFVDAPEIGSAQLGWLLISGAGNVAGLLLAYSALRVGKVGVVAPIVSTEGAIAAMASVVAGEPLQASATWLLVLIACGVALAASGPSTDPVQVDVAVNAAGVGTRREQRRPLVLACLGAGCFGASLYATGRASAELPIPWVMLPARLIGVLVIAMPLLVTSRLMLTRAAAPLVVVGGLCEVLGFASYALGSRHGLAIAAVLTSQFAGMAAVAAFVLFRERLTRLQVSGVVVVAVGVAVLSALRA